jgi:hypothetical protein
MTALQAFNDIPFTSAKIQNFASPQCVAVRIGEVIGELGEFCE